MPARKQLFLSQEQVQELVATRDRHRVPHLREKAAALLKVWAGESRRQVARCGLHKPVCPETVGIWITTYQAEGLAGWHVKAGRGRKPVFSPSP